MQWGLNSLERDSVSGRALSRRSLLVKEASRPGSVPDMCLTPRMHPATHPTRPPASPCTPRPQLLLSVRYTRIPPASHVPCPLCLLTPLCAHPGAAHSRSAPPHTATAPLCGDGPGMLLLGKCPCSCVVSDEGPDSFELRVWT